MNSSSRNLVVVVPPATLLPALPTAAHGQLAHDRHPALGAPSRDSPPAAAARWRRGSPLSPRCSARRPESLPWAGLRYQHTQAVRAKLAETRAPAGVNKILAAVRGVLREAWRLGLMDAETYERAADIKSVRGEQLPRGRALGKRELQKLFVACAKDETAAGRRDAALIAVLYGGGLRRSEVVALDLADYLPETAELRIRHGKGQKGRVCYATNGAKLALDAWLVARGSEQGRCSGRPMGEGDRW